MLWKGLDIQLWQMKKHLLLKISIAFHILDFFVFRGLHKSLLRKHTLHFSWWLG